MTEHLEDNIFNKGYPGAKEAIDYLYSLHEMLESHSRKAVNITTKWDGAPAVICGTDPESGKFFVGTKGVFAQTPKINFTPADIDRHHPGEGLRVKLKAALQYLSKLNWSGTVAQGDLLFTKGEPKAATIAGEEYLVFKPNTITYAVPMDSDLAKEIAAADIGIVFHTEYVGGPKLADTTAKYGFDSSRLGSARGVWHRDAIIRDLSGTVTFTQAESAQLMESITEANNYLKQIDAKTFDWLKGGTDLAGTDFIVQLKAHTNAQVRKGAFDEPSVFAKTFVTKYVAYMTKIIEEYKTDKSKQAATEKMVQVVQFIRQHIPEIVAVYDLYLKLMESKNQIVKKLMQIQQMPTFIEQPDGSYKVTGEEGFVAVDRLGGALKLVDRLEFSRHNFGSGKPGA
jgi:hypothetical protein